MTDSIAKADLTRTIKRYERDLASAKMNVANGCWAGIHAARIYISLRWLRQVRQRMNAMSVSEAWSLDLPKRI